MPGDSWSRGWAAYLFFEARGNMLLGRRTSPLAMGGKQPAGQKMAKSQVKWRQRVAKNTRNRQDCQSRGRREEKSSVPAILTASPQPGRNATRENPDRVAVRLRGINQLPDDHRDPQWHEVIDKQLELAALNEADQYGECRNADGHRHKESHG
jgi:hypothetical protein